MEYVLHLYRDPPTISLMLIWSTRNEYKSRLIIHDMTLASSYKVKFDDIVLKRFVAGLAHRRLKIVPDTLIIYEVFYTG